MIASSLHAALAYGEKRHAFGQPLTSHQGLRWSLVDVADDPEALRALAWQAGRVTVPAVTACIHDMGTEHALGRHLVCAKIAAFTDGSTEMVDDPA